MIPADLTLLIGPHTRLALAVNASVRQGRGALAGAGLTALPSRLASPAARALALGEGPEAARREAFAAALGDAGRPAVLAALNFLGAPSEALARRELFPDMGALCLGLGRVLDPLPRLVLAVEPLDLFFASVGSEALERRVSATAWDILYEISWADLAADIVTALPGVDLMVMTPESALCRPAALAAALFGEAASVLDPEAWRAAHLAPEGQAALAQMDDAHATETLLLDLGARLGAGMSDADLEARFGIDRLTRTLLRQRFDEDLAEISDLPGVRML